MHHTTLLANTFCMSRLTFRVQCPTSNHLMRHWFATCGRLFDGPRLNWLHIHMLSFWSINYDYQGVTNISQVEFLGLLCLMSYSKIPQLQHITRYGEQASNWRLRIDPCCAFKRQDFNRHHKTYWNSHVHGARSIQRGGILCYGCLWFRCGEFDYTVTWN